MGYLMSGQHSELDRLRLQSRVWEPAGASLLAELGHGEGKNVVDVGCGAMGWLRLLSGWVGLAGECVGTDVDPAMIAAAEAFRDEERLAPCTLLVDDLFDSRLPAGDFDLVHARFQLAPLGRYDDQLTAYLRLLRPGGVLVLEDPDSHSWRHHPEAPAAERLVEVIREAFRLAGGDFDAGAHEFSLLAERGLEPSVRAHVVALEPGHPYLQLPVQFATALRPRLLTLMSEDELDGLLREASDQLGRPGTWGTTFTLVQTWARVP